jgi:hypothetical protein
MKDDDPIDITFDSIVAKGFDAVRHHYLKKWW